MQKYTRKNPNNRGYRIPFINQVEMRITTNANYVTITGDLVDKLGEYEALGYEPEELKEIINKLGLRKGIRWWRWKDVNR